MSKWTLNDARDVKGKNIIVTGANTGLGYETSFALASLGANVIMACRSLKRAETAKERILSTYPNASIDIILIDLGDLESVKRFVKEYEQKYETLDVLINNAGVMITPYMKTKDGFEFQNGINHLGHFALTAQLFPLLTKTKNSRIVVVSSIAHRNATIDFDNYLFKKENTYTPMKSYRQSKLSNLLFMYELNRRLEDSSHNVKVLAAHPGVSRSELTRYALKGFLKILVSPFFYLFTQSAKKGALPQLRAALDEDVKTSDYYGPNNFNETRGNPVIVKAMPNALDKINAKKLWERSVQLTGCDFKI